jgi:hypothetical protein
MKQVATFFFVAGQDVAIRAASSQRTTYNSFVSGLAVDGDLSTGSCTVTSGSGQQWWSVDLGYPRLVMGVRVLNEDSIYHGKCPLLLTIMNEHWGFHIYLFAAQPKVIGL